MKKIIDAQDSNTYCQKAIAPPPAFLKPLTKSHTSLTSLIGQIQSDSLYDTQSEIIDTDTESVGRISCGGSERRGGGATDEHDTSFRYNGTEMDFNPEPEPIINDYHILFDNLPLKPFIDPKELKKPRSNSLTTAENKHNVPMLMAALLCSSNEDLSQKVNKHHGYSILTENPRSLFTASGSDTQINDVKSTYQTFQSPHPGMKYVGAWLKKLRLHKYSYLFEKCTFEQMMSITNEYLERLHITKGARDKLVNSIQKLKERYIRMMQAEQDLNSGKMLINAAIEILSDVVTTPMKPMDIYNTCDVTNQFLSLLMSGEFFFDSYHLHL